MTGVKTNKLITTLCLPNSLYEIMRRRSRHHVATIELSFEYTSCITEEFSNTESMKTCKSSSLICERLATVLCCSRNDEMLMCSVLSFCSFQFLSMQALEFFNVINFLIYST
jgi:hypothetical protein